LSKGEFFFISVFPKGRNVNEIYTTELKPGVVFSSPVFTLGKNLLVPAHVPLRQKDIDLLIALEIDIVRIGENAAEAEEPIEPEPIVFPLEIGIVEIEEKVIEAEETEPVPVKLNFSINDVRKNTGSYRAYKNLITKLNSVFIGIKSGLDIEMRTIDNIAIQLLQDLRDYHNSFIDFILGGEVSGHELAKSSVNTAILSALTALELHLANHKIHNVIAGALLHDIGMLRLSKGITEKKGGLSEAELEQIKSHPLHTSKIVTKELFGPNEVNLIALQHHERWDGKGYPDQIAGAAIDIGARIVSVADAFEAMVSKKSYRDSIIGYQAVKNLLADNASRFDPEVISVFTKIMGIYPIGSIVRLNNNSVARVISINTKTPLRPIIEMLIDKDGKVIDHKDIISIDLLEDKTIFIKSAIDPAEFDDSNE
jgi:HD-GYP domain-containing protein (c-di-GMP phosphodiesterase class II)